MRKKMNISIAEQKLMSVYEYYLEWENDNKITEVQRSLKR